MVDPDTGGPRHGHTALLSRRLIHPPSAGSSRATASEAKECDAVSPTSTPPTQRSLKALSTHPPHPHPLLEDPDLRSFSQRVPSSNHPRSPLLRPPCHGPAPGKVFRPLRCGDRHSLRIWEETASGSSSSRVGEARPCITVGAATRLRPRRLGKPGRDHLSQRPRLRLRDPDQEPSANYQSHEATGPWLPALLSAYPPAVPTPSCPQRHVPYRPPQPCQPKHKHRTPKHAQPHKGSGSRPHPGTSSWPQPSVCFRLLLPQQRKDPHTGHAPLGSPGEWAGSFPMCCGAQSVGLQFHGNPSHSPQGD